MNTYKLTLLALLAAIAVIGRYIFVFIPNVQPVTAIIIIGGLFLGPGSAFLLAVLVTFLSNMILGMGIWAIWQIVSWGLIGIISGLIGKYFKKVPISIILIYSLVAGYLYGLTISLTTYQVSGQFWPYYLAGLPFDTYHAIGNVLFMIIFYPAISYFFNKYIEKHLQPPNT